MRSKSEPNPKINTKINIKKIDNKNKPKLKYNAKPKSKSIPSCLNVFVTDDKQKRHLITLRKKHKARSIKNNSLASLFTTDSK